MKPLGKLLFPKAQPHERRRQMRALLVAIGIGILFAAIAVGLILLAYHSRRFRS